MPVAVESLRIAVILPCYNEEAAIYEVVRDFRAALPQAAVYVYDNNSKDRTAERAAQAGAIVRRETRQGKGHVLRRMFADVEADVYVLADGDGTYAAGSAPEMVAKLVDEHLDMVVGSRLTDFEGEAFRRGDLAAVPAAISDEMVETYSAAGPLDKVRARVEATAERADGLFLTPPTYFISPEELSEYQNRIIESFAPAAPVG